MKKKLFIASIFSIAFAFQGLCEDKKKETEQEILMKNQYVELPLQTGRVYTIKVKSDNGPTTVLFPSKISKINGINVVKDPYKTSSGKYNGDFWIQSKPGAYYFNLFALNKGGQGTITVIYNRKAYILRLVQDNKEAFSAVNFSNNLRRQTSRKSISNARLISLIDVSKVFHRLKQHYPYDFKNASSKRLNSIFDFDKFKIILLEAFRFTEDDTIVFKCLMENPGNEEIKYDRFSFTADIAGRIYYMSAADASGTMPPKSSTFVFFSITGTPNGRRNDLTLNNDFKVGVTANYMLKAYETAKYVDQTKIKSIMPPPKPSFDPKQKEDEDKND